MTEIRFYHNAPDKIAAAALLIGELYREGRRVLVYAPDREVGASIDRTLWTQPAIGFVPHCASASRLAPETPVVVADSLDELRYDDVLMNLNSALPNGFGRFQRLVEIVTTDEDDRALARERFKFYRDRGYPLSAREFAQR
jgi:DNA polymerase-3 subunit chi